MELNSNKIGFSSTEKDLTTNVSIEKLQTVIMFLTTKYAQTKDVKFAVAAYQHLCMVNDHNEAGPELKFFCQSLVMEWRAIAWKPDRILTQRCQSLQ